MEGARPAGPGDEATCRSLLDEALQAAGAMRGGPRLVGSRTSSALLARWAECGSAATLQVGTLDGTVVGLAAAVAVEGDEDRTARIECCYVESGARGVGVGTALLATLVAWSSAQGCVALDAVALPGDRLSKQRFEAAGLSARLLVLSRRLEAPD